VTSLGKNMTDAGSNTQISTMIFTIKNTISLKSCQKEYLVFVLPGSG
jgi:hypothetical protein